MRTRFLDWGFFIDASEFIHKPNRGGKRIRKINRIARAA